VNERPKTTLDIVKRALRRDGKLPLGTIVAKGLRFSTAVAAAPVHLRECDQVGRRVRTIGLPDVQNLGRLTIGTNAIINSKPVAVRLSTSARGAIDIGDDFIFNYGASIASDASVRLGHRVTLGPFARICDYEGDPPGEAAPVVLGDDVWLTIRVRVLKGVTIGAGTIVTAGSLVTSDLPPHVIAGGVPARPIKDRKVRDVERDVERRAPSRSSAPSRMHELVHRGGEALDRYLGRFALGAADELGPSASVHGRAHVENLGTMRIGARFRLQSSPDESHLTTGPGGSLVVGDDVSIGSGTSITAQVSVRIGSRVDLGDGVMVMDTNFHGTDDFMSESATAPVVIEDDVRIGSRVTILKGSTIGRGAHVVADSVVAGAIAPGVTAAGVPARPV
jgi:acetyltransferase-like isoleucine patch superfamily enzyme